MPELVDTFHEVVAASSKRTGSPPGPLFLGGKSMGGRYASLLAAEGEPLDGLIFLGYPLHPPNRPEKLRADHLKDIACAMLFIQGTRDSLCRLDLLHDTLRPIKAATTLHVIDDADHSFKVLKRTGRAESEVWDEIVDVVAAWMGKAIPR